MFGLLDDNEPPPTFTFSALVALVASAGAASFEAFVLWQLTLVSNEFFFMAILGAILGITPVAGLAGVLCAIALYFKQDRWVRVAVAIMAVPYALFAIYLIVTSAAEAFTR
jgi:hypothetical protein